MADKAVDDLVIQFPAGGGYLEICRLNATAMAASAGFDVGELDDIRLAVDEAVAWLLSDGSGHTVELTINRSVGEISFAAILRGPDIPERELHDLINAILGATTDSYDAGRGESGHRYVTFSKRAGNG